MQYETAAQMADRLGVSIRMVQLWAKDGKLIGAIKQGRDWLIPAGLQKPDKKGYTQTMELIPLPLINGGYTPGQGPEYIDTIEGDDLKQLAMAEYYHFTGRAHEASQASEVFFNHKDTIIRLSACLIHSFSSLSLGQVHLARMGLECIHDSLETELSENSTPQFKAACVLAATTAAVLTHVASPKLKLKDYIKYLPRGLQLWAAYILAHEAFLEEDYNRALGIVETILSIQTGIFPVPMVYLHISAAISLMALKRVEEAKEHFYKAWDIAQPDGYIEGFAEYNGLLCGLVETCLKTENPETYKKITEITYNFTSSWRKVHNDRKSKQITASLTTTEFAIAMLASRGWSNMEISEYMGFSLHTVKKHISTVFQKLGIASRNELKRFMH